MPTYTIFIAHSNEDTQLAAFIRNCLSRINEFKPYMATDFKNLGENFKERIQKAIQDSDFFVVFLTKSGTESQWVNQELGYACAVKKSKRNFRIIPITQSTLNLKGFITKDSDDLLFLDKEENLLFQHILLTIRNTIPSGLNEGVLNIIYECDTCLDNRGLPLRMLGQIPSHEIMLRLFDNNDPTTAYPCDCGRYIVLDLFTFDRINVVLRPEHVSDPFEKDRIRRMRPR